LPIGPSKGKKVTTSILEAIKDKKVLSAFELQGIINKLQKIKGVKKEEIDLVMKHAERYGNEIPVPKLLSAVESELLPLTPSHVKRPRWARVGSDYLEGGKYGEVVYESPIKTSAQGVHFGNESFTSGGFQDFPGYVGHVRYEDTLDPRLRRVIEWQSDLMQKGNLERELGTEGLKLTHIDDINTSIKYRGIQQTADNMSPDGIAAIQRAFNEAKKDPLSYSDNTIKKWGEVIDRLKKLGPRTEQVNRLKAYAEDFAIHKRMFREEIKRAAIDGKRYLETPKGDTAMKIEGLGETRS